MNFGPAEMAQMMDGSKALITFTMVSSISIGLVLGVIVAFWKLHREGVPLAMVPDNRVTPFKRRIFPFRLKIFLLTVAVGGGVLYVGYASHRLDIVKSPDTRQRLDTPQRADTPQRVDTPQRPDTPQRVDVRKDRIA